MVLVESFVFLLDLLFYLIDFVLLLNFKAKLLHLVHFTRLLLFLVHFPVPDDCLLLELFRAPLLFVDVTIQSKIPLAGVGVVDLQ